MKIFQIEPELYNHFFRKYKTSAKFWLFKSDEIDDPKHTQNAWSACKAVENLETNTDSGKTKSQKKKYDETRAAS